MSVLQVALFSENSSRWLVADQAVMTLGAADAVRGASSPAEEMAYIVSHSESCAIVAQDSQTLERLAPALASSSSQNGNGNGASYNGVQTILKLISCASTWNVSCTFCWYCMHDVRSKHQGGCVF